MGTRSLTAVYLDGEYKVAQYGHWDGYPEGQGLEVLTFLRKIMDIELFKYALRNTAYISDRELSEIRKRCDSNGNGFVSIEEIGAIMRDYPELSRGGGAEILQLVQDNPDGIRLKNCISFAADSMFCEWAWVIDLDAGTFEGYKGSNKIPLTENDRFYFLRSMEVDSCHGVRLAARWSLDDLPNETDFLEAFQKDLCS